MAEDPEEAEDDPSVLTPEELRIEDERDDEIKKIGENRYLISPNEGGEGGTDESSGERPARGDAGLNDARIDDAGLNDARVDDASASTGSAPEGSIRRPDEPGAPTDRPHSSGESDDVATGDDGPVTGPDVELEPRAVALEHSSGRHGIDVVVSDGDDIAERRITADDRIDAFEEFLRWYARQVDPDGPPAATISALLAEADLSD